MSVEHPRCAQCRNPIRGRQTFIRLASAGMSFHQDCWVELHALVQTHYQSEYAEIGVPALLKPYHRGELSSWLPAMEAEDPTEVADPEPAPEVAAVVPTATALGPAPEEPVTEEPVLAAVVVEEPVPDLVRTRPTKFSRGDRARAFAGRTRGMRQAGSPHTSAAS